MIVAQNAYVHHMGWAVSTLQNERVNKPWRPRAWVLSQTLVGAAQDCQVSQLIASLSDVTWGGHGKVAFAS